MTLWESSFDREMREYAERVAERHPLTGKPLRRCTPPTEPLPVVWVITTLGPTTEPAIHRHAEMRSW